MRRLAGVCIWTALVVGCAGQQTPVARQAPPQGHTTFHEPEPANFDDHTGFTQLFDGKTLAGWEGDPDFWRVEDGVLVGESSKEKPLSNTYLWKKGLEVKDFDLRLEIKCAMDGSGIQYRSQVGLPWNRPLRAGEKPRNLQWMMTGPQADFYFPTNAQHGQYTGQIYSENTPLGIVAWRGEVVQAGPGEKPTLLGTIGERAPLGGWVNVTDWNQYEIIARGGVLMHLINGHLMAVLVDDDPESSNNRAGKIGIELESTPAKVQVRNIWLKVPPAPSGLPGDARFRE